jgi:hypothetical protein
VRRLVAAAAAAAALLAPLAARACPVCGQGAGESEGAYLIMSGILSALPLLMAGGIAWWILRRSGASEAQECRARNAVRSDRLPALHADSPRGP